MLLSSMRRLRVHVMGMQAAPLSTKLDNDRLLSMWLASVSDMIEKYLDRGIGIGSHIEYFSLMPEKRLFTVKCTPITTLTSVYYDPTGLWEGDESEIEDCFIDESDSSIVLPYVLGIKSRKGLRITYTGGLTAHAVNGVIQIDTGTAATWIAGKYCIGKTSGARGIVVSATNVAGASALLTVEHYYGEYSEGEVLEQYDNEDGTGTASATSNTSTYSTEPLARVAPAIVQACDAQVRYMWKHTTDFENSGTAKDGSSIRRDNGAGTHWPLQPEVIDMLQPYVRYTF